jgi:hypothetical protein
MSISRSRSVRHHPLAQSSGEIRAHECNTDIVAQAHVQSAQLLAMTNSD